MSKLLFSFNGRISRQPYWMYSLFIFIGTLIFIFIDVALSEQGVVGLTILFTLLTIWPSLAIQVKRWHDRDKSGWWVLINIIPIVGPIWAFVENGFLSGTEGSNRFGENPIKQTA